MAMPGSMAAAAGSVPGNKVGSAIIWTVGAVMTYAAFDQISGWSPGTLFIMTVVAQVILTLGQSPVWRGRGNLMSYTCLVVDAVINFGGVMAFMVNVDQMGSVQSLGATFFGWAGELPLPLKGGLALFFAAVIAGLPEFLWRLD